ncbi:thioredoxin family protein [Altererythrobacter sp. CC-YST694]|uniref:protein-disulfide reductase DsbD family protein n=1 Tax=Altererythrobacter sp. CC-YST694 TaxID=2755038 RepID=UPI001D02D342|nr:thioredoxin family protein [Altererythrobacter sp. CC-YST694]MCB5423899.1 thioredoxin family protein [Altererythrobacter sp. CC-YST694]
MAAIRCISLLLALLVAALSPVPAAAQGRANHIAGELVAQGPATPGGRVQLAFVMKPEPGWHGYWSNPGDAGYGMELEWSLPPGWQAGELEYPVPQTLLISGMMNHVFEGPYAILTTLSVPSSATVGATVPVTVHANWLACTDKICVPEQALMATTIKVGAGGAIEPRFDQWRTAIPPLLDRSANFAFAGNKLRIAIPLPESLEIAAPHLFLAENGLIDYAAPQTFRRQGNTLVAELALAKNAQPSAEAISGILKLDDDGNGIRFAGQPGAVPPGGKVLETATSGAVDGLPAFPLLLAMALAGGLLLNIMPCVFPILSLKAMSLARAGESEAEARREGLAYTAGVVLACLGLGALMLGLRAGGAEIGWAFQLQEPGVVAALLVLAVAITANFAALYELPSLSVSGGGQSMGAFATGLLAAFVATPCTGPFMAAAMGAALLLPAAQAMLLFAALGLGIALPFLALGFIPALRRRLPRPGKWMNTFRKVMAVPMALTAMALAWLAWRLGGWPFLLVAVGLAVLFLAVLIVAGRRQRAGQKTWPLVAGAVPVLALAGALVLPQSMAPPPSAETGIIAARPFSETALAEARASGKPVFVWFTADWCLTCKVNEGVAIEREETKQAFEKAGVVALVGDWTRRDPAITRFLSAHGAGGVPLYLWYPAGGGEPQQLPQVLTPASLKELAGAS